MKVVFVSNYFNHHQKFLCDELDRCCMGQFNFISTIPMSEERKALGYNLEELPKYVLVSYQSSKEKERCMELICTADIVIAGSVPYSMIRKRIKERKVIFRYCERPIRRKLEVIKNGYRFLKWHIQYPEKNPVYVLCASGFTAADFSKFHIFKNKMFRWGYFPQTKKYEDIDELIAKKDKKEILWCGRFLKLKHPDDVIKVVDRLGQEDYDFHVTFIGRGELERELKNKVEQMRLNSFVSFVESMKPEQVREYMEQSGIYLFTSDYQEGWGAVLNESMNSGCAVVASHAIGSVPFLIDHKKNGLVYESENVEQLYENIKYLLDHPSEQERLGKAAYNTIVGEWNAEIAAKRFISLADAVLNEKECQELYKHGPCSKATHIKDNWFRKEY